MHTLPSSPTRTAFSSTALTSTSRQGIVFTLAFAVPPPDPRSMLPKINVKELASIPSKDLPFSPPPTAPSSPSQADKARWLDDRVNAADPSLPTPTTPTFPLDRSQSPSTDGEATVPTSASITASDADEAHRHHRGEVPDSDLRSSSPAKHTQRTAARKARRHSLPSSGRHVGCDGLDLSVRIHHIASDLLAARLLGPGRSALLRPAEDGTIVLPSQVKNRSNYHHNSCTAARTVPLQKSASIPSVISSAATEPKRSTQNTIPNKRSSSSDEDFTAPKNSKRRRHSAPEVPTPAQRQSSQNAKQVSHQPPVVVPVPSPKKEKVVQSCPAIDFDDVSSGPLVCQFCGVRKTGQWRRGPAGQRTLCNACGINWSKKVKAEVLRRGCSVAEAESIVGADTSRFRKVVLAANGSPLSDVEEGEEDFLDEDVGFSSSNGEDA
ncbi:blue light receptor [Dinochytrium kinnereticum]|nr:blue light receptor [Dinochytrium kinnereticum]